MLRIQNGNNQVLHSECIHVHVYIFIYFYILCCKILLLTDIHVDIQRIARKETTCICIECICKTYNVHVVQNGLRVTFAVQYKSFFFH